MLRDINNCRPRDCRAEEDEVDKRSIKTVGRVMMRLFVYEILSILSARSIDLDASNPRFYAPKIQVTEIKDEVNVGSDDHRRRTFDDDCGGRLDG